MTYHIQRSHRILRIPSKTRPLPLQMSQSSVDLPSAWEANQPTPLQQGHSIMAQSSITVLIESRCTVELRSAFIHVSGQARGAALRAAVDLTGCSRTPGLSPFRNSIPEVSSVEITCESVDVREPISPGNDSIRRMVPIATRERFASSTCSHPISARAARSCLPVIKNRS